MSGSWDVLVDGNEEFTVEADELGIQSVLADALMKRFAVDGAAAVQFGLVDDAGGDGEVLDGTFDDRLIATFVFRRTGSGWSRR